MSWPTRDGGKHVNYTGETCRVCKGAKKTGTQYDIPKVVKEVNSVTALGRGVVRSFN